MNKSISRNTMMHYELRAAETYTTESDTSEYEEDPGPESEEEDREEN